MTNKRNQDEAPVSSIATGSPTTRSARSHLPLIRGPLADGFTVREFSREASYRIVGVPTIDPGDMPCDDALPAGPDKTGRD